MLIQSCFWFLLAALVAGLEVEIEGKDGWAYKLPTPYRTRGFAARVYGTLMAGKPLTVYHAYMFSLMLLVHHAGFFMDAPWSWSAESAALARFLTWAVLWDYLWFVLNPHYGVRGFTKDRVWWHAKSRWVFGLFPLDYLIGWTLSALVALAGGMLARHLVMLGLFLIGTALTMLASPLYHRWYVWMRLRDDRPDVIITSKEATLT